MVCVVVVWLGMARNDNFPFRDSEGKGRVEDFIDKILSMGSKICAPRERILSDILVSKFSLLKATWVSLQRHCSSQSL